MTNYPFEISPPFGLVWQEKVEFEILTRSEFLEEKAQLTATVFCGLNLPNRPIFKTNKSFSQAQNFYGPTNGERVSDFS